MKYKTPRAEAIKNGEETYQGKSCSAGHSGVRNVKDRRCVECSSGPDSYYQRNKEARKEYARSRPKNRTLYDAARQRAIKFDREFDLELEDIIIPEICPVLGIPMDSPSLDRIDNSKGYTKDNVHVISWRANKLRGDGTPSELRAIADYFENMSDMSIPISDIEHLSMFESS